ncbi:MAG: succinylglutamate desuccinylase/aspartoacylase family protein, partial [Vicinamibacteria bacterium]
FREKFGARAGEKTKTWLPVGSDPLSEVRLPLWVAAGKDEGPLIAVTGGVHGAEYAGILAAIRVFGDLDPSRLKGTVAVIPLSSPVAFSRITRYVCPIDNLNLNRVFPGDSNGSFTQRLASVIFDNVVSQAQYAIDLHSGDFWELQLPHVKFYVTGNEEVDRASRMVATAFTERFFHPILPEKRAIAGALFIEAARAGVPSIISEAGSEGRLSRRDVEVDVEFHKRGVMNFLRHLGVSTDRDPATASECEEVVEEVTPRANHGGMFLPVVSTGDRIEEGQLLGEIRNLDDEVLEAVRAPFAGIVRMQFTVGAVNTGDPLMHLWQTKRA